MKKFIIRNIFFLFLLIFISGCAKPAAIQEENIVTYSIDIPGLKKEYEFLYITDTHIIVPSEKEDTRILEYSRERLSAFASQAETASDISFADWVEYANVNEFTGLLLGGDIIDCPSPSNLEYLASCLAGLRIPYAYTLGNHDWTYPWEYMTDAGREEYLPLLSSYMEGNPVIHTLEYEEFIIVAVDNSSNQIHPAALEQYKAVLFKNKPVILMLHVPLYTESVLAKAKNEWQNPVILGGGIHGGIYPDAVSAEFIALTTSKDSTVAAVLAGHVHFADKGTIAGEKNVPQIVGDAGYKGRGARIRITGAQP